MKPKKEKPWHWPFQRINSNGAREYACRHGVGHGGLHGCDGCCKDPIFREVSDRDREGRDD